MDSEMLNRFYETIEDDAVLIHLGDVAMDMQDGRETIERFRDLSGDLLVRGNHDTGLEPSDAPFPVVKSSVIEHDDRQFYLTHRPEDAPDCWDGWVIHGHHHNNNPEEFPSIHYDEQRVNVSSELLGYRPVKFDSLVKILNECTTGDRIRDADTALERFADQIAAE